MKKMKLFALCLGDNVMVDKWGNLIASTSKSEIKKQRCYDDFLQNGSEIKEIEVKIK